MSQEFGPSLSPPTIWIQSSSCLQKWSDTGEKKTPTYHHFRHPSRCTELGKQTHRMRMRTLDMPNLEREATKWEQLRTLLIIWSHSQIPTDHVNSTDDDLSLVT